MKMWENAIILQILSSGKRDHHIIVCTLCMYTLYYYFALVSVRIFYVISKSHQYLFT